MCSFLVCLVRLTFHIDTGRTDVEGVFLFCFFAEGHLSRTDDRCHARIEHSKEVKYGFSAYYRSSQHGPRASESVPVMCSND